MSKACPHMIRDTREGPRGSSKVSLPVFDGADQVIYSVVSTKSPEWSARAWGLSQESATVVDVMIHALKMICLLVWVLVHNWQLYHKLHSKMDSVHETILPSHLWDF